MKVHSGGTEAEYTYNADGLRQSKTVNGVTTKQIWDGSNIVGETDGSGAVLSVYTRGLKGVISDRAGEEETYYIYDGHGDVNMLMDSTGEIIKQYSYDAFGVEQNKDDSDTNPFRYCGEYFDNETESIYLRARYYDPGSGRFITEDPIRDGLNWYSYAANNPIKFVDPWGLTIVTGGSFILDDTTYKIGNMATVDTELISKNDKISINEIENNVFVYAYLDFNDNFDVNGASIFSYNLYKDLAIEGIESFWSGTYQGKSISTTVLEVVSDTSQNKQKTINVSINNKLGVSHAYFTYKDLGKVYDAISLYVGDSRNNTLYTMDQFKAVSAHEFGHTLGLADVYNTPYDSPYTIMGSSELYLNHAMTIDFENMLKYRGLNIQKL